MFERQVALATNDGRMNTFICHPDRGGPHPAIIFLMDAPGIREELRDMARRLATAGYYVMLPNLYYRSNVEELGSVIGEPNIGTRQKALQLMTTINVPLVMQDIDALVAFAADDAAASKGAMGCVGYCMSGPYAINAAARYPERVRAAASIYGVALVTDRADSPHLAAKRTDARLYFGCAGSDHYAPLEMIDRLRAELAAQGGNAEVEIYPGAQHGFAFPSRPAYDKPAAERHWERLFALFGEELKR
ncbi:MAG: dienelactone hydrolase family protein [Pseudomonadota bacterium]|nr:dienelactone hydrolase family protein [Pseudomonadota bacterium]